MTTSVLDRYFAAMRRGAEAEEDMMALFADDATYAEPFSGLEPAVGTAAIRERLRAGWATPLPDFELDVLTVETTDAGATTTWECRSAAFDGPRHGRDEYTIRDGVIVALVVTMIDPGPAD